MVSHFRTPFRHLFSQSASLAEIVVADDGLQLLRSVWVPKEVKTQAQGKCQPRCYLPFVLHKASARGGRNSEIEERRLASHRVAHKSGFGERVVLNERKQVGECERGLTVLLSEQRQF